MEEYTTKFKGDGTMRFPKKTLRLLSVRTHTKGEKNYTFVKLADEATFENNDFMLNREETSPDSLVAQNRYDVELQVDGRYSTVTLTPVSSKA